jgi:hypothetical protein
MGRKKIVTVEKNTGTARPPTEGSVGDRSSHIAKLGEKVLELDRAKVQVKGIKDEIDKLKADIEANNFDDENQLGMFDGKGDDDDKPTAMAAAQAQARKQHTNGAAAEHP